MWSTEDRESSDRRYSDSERAIFILHWCTRVT